MGDPLQERTRRLLTDYILFCAREPGTPEPPPTSVEAAVLRSVTRQIQQKHQDFFSSLRDYQGNRPELVRWMTGILFSSDRDFTWGHLVALLALAGTLMNQGPCRTVEQRRDLRNRLQVDQDCYLTVNLLYNLLMDRHRSWLEAHGGWDGFCRFFKNSSPPDFWSRLLIWAFLSGLFATAVFYIWKHL